MQSGNVRGAVGDGVGVVIDVFAAAVPFVPGGVGVIRNGAKVVDAIDNVTDITKAAKAAEMTNKVTDSVNITHDSESTLVKIKSLRGGENADTKLGRQMHKDYNPWDSYIKEFKLPSGKRVDAINFEKGDIRELKPNNSRAVQRGEKQVKSYMNEVQNLYPNIKWEWHIDVYNK